MEISEENINEAEKVVLKYAEIMIEYIPKSFRKKSRECAIQDRQSVLDENESVFKMLKLHGDLRTRLPIHERITNLQQQIIYLQSKI